MYIPAPEHLQSPRSPAVLPACACTEGGENGRKILSLALPFPSRWHCHSPLCSYVPRSKPPRKFSTPVLHLIRAVICRDRSPLSGGRPLRTLPLPGAAPRAISRTRAQERRLQSLAKPRTRLVSGTQISHSGSLDQTLPEV